MAHAGNAAVVQQELRSQHGITVSLRTVERACAPWRRELAACAPYRPRTKGKDERSVGYVKRNAMAGHTFESWAHLQQHLDWWMREVADQRVHGTTGEIPAERFRIEREHLMPLADRPPFEQMRRLSRRVARDATVEIDTNRYSVPWRLAGRLVQISIAGCELRVLDEGREVACHPELAGRRQTRCLPEHLQGIVGYRAPGQTAMPLAVGERGDEPIPVVPHALLQRDLSVYEAVAGGGWQ